MCGCYGSHKAVGLSRICKGPARKCRQHELRRLTRGLHPDRRSGLFLEDIRHYARGKFWVQSKGAVRPEGPSDDGVADQPASAAREGDVDEGHYELEELEAMEAEAERAAAGLLHDPPPPAKRLKTGARADPHEEDEDGDEDDVFEFGHDMRQAAYTSGGGAGEVPRDVVASPAAAHGMPSSLAQIEERLEVLGEVPCFRPTEASYLVHRCSTIVATISFWPGTLQWSTDGPQGDIAYDAIAGSASAAAV